MLCKKNGLTPEGRAKILDFGLAKLSEPVESSPEAVTQPRALTEEGAVVGTTPYMSPEQAEVRKLDARSDIFSFGAVLYEMVTGRKPFPGDSRMAILNKILSEDPTPPGQFNAAIPPELDCSSRDQDFSVGQQRGCVVVAGMGEVSRGAEIRFGEELRGCGRERQQERPHDRRDDTQSQAKPPAC